MIKVISFNKLKAGKKKYSITFMKNGKKYVRKFGASGMSDYTIHKDKKRRERYISRHKKDLKTNDPMPMLRPPDLVSPGEIGKIIGLEPMNQAKVRFRRGDFLIPIEKLLKNESLNA